MAGAIAIASANNEPDFVMAHDQTLDIPSIRRANKSAAAEFFGVSIPSIDGWLRRGCPYIQRGERGTQWVLDLLAIAEWRFSGTASSDDDPEQMRPKERLDWYRGTEARIRYMQSVGELIPAAEYEKALSGALKSVAMTLESLPDVLERDAGIDGNAVERCQIVIDRVREEIYQRITA